MIHRVTKWEFHFILSNTLLKDFLHIDLVKSYQKESTRSLVEVKDILLFVHHL